MDVIGVVCGWLSFVVGRGEMRKVTRACARRPCGAQLADLHEHGVSTGAPLDDVTVRAAWGKTRFQQHLIDHRTPPFWHK